MNKSRKTSVSVEDPEPQYQWPPQRDPNLDYGKKPRNPIHSIVTALPIVMVLVALLFYYLAESEQSHGSPIRAESVTLEAIMTGLSSSGGNAGRHFLWVDVDNVTKGVRVHATDMPRLQTLIRQRQIILKIAPTIQGSDTYWAWYVEQDGEVFLDAESQLR